MFTVIERLTTHWETETGRVRETHSNVQAQYVSSTDSAGKGANTPKYTRWTSKRTSERQCEMSTEYIRWTDRKCRNRTHICSNRYYALLNNNNKKTYANTSILCVCENESVRLLLLLVVVLGRLFVSFNIFNTQWEVPISKANSLVVASKLNLRFVILHFGITTSLWLFLFNCCYRRFLLWRSGEKHIFFCSVVRLVWVNGGGITVHTADDFTNSQVCVNWVNFGNFSMLLKINTCIYFPIRCLSTNAIRRINFVHINKYCVCEM